MLNSFFNVGIFESRGSSCLDIVVPSFLLFKVCLDWFGCFQVIWNWIIMSRFSEVVGLNPLCIYALL